MFMESIVEADAAPVPYRDAPRPQTRRLKPRKVARNYVIFTAIMATIVAFWAACIAGLMLLLP